MGVWTDITRAGKRALLGVSALAAAGGLIATPAGAATVSSNWAGYVASPRASRDVRFESVSGSWRVPSASCRAGRESFSAIWVGLGGADENPRALEQIGSEADCAPSGSALYSTWYELFPAAPVNLRMRARPGNAISASVTVHGRDATLRLRNLTTGARFSTTKRLANIDVATAEWIVEAPTVCATENSCGMRALTDFGRVAFTSATATAARHTRAVADGDWSAEALELWQSPGRGVGLGRRFTPSRPVISAVPSSPPGRSGAFSVSWQEQSAPLEAPSPPTFPGFGGES